MSAYVELIERLKVVIDEENADADQFESLGDPELAALRISRVGLHRKCIAAIEWLSSALDQEEKSHSTTIDQRDAAECFADELAHAIAGIAGEEIGEHSNLNCPWTNALEISKSLSNPTAVFKE